MAVTPQRRHLSLLRSFTPADVLTVGNASCGTIAIFLCLDYLASGNRRFLWTAFVLLPLALILDVLDGYVARLNTRRQSVMGGDLDSLSDVISFGVAPAGIAYAAGLDWVVDQVILMYFVGCGVSRLARYNVTAGDLARETGKVTYFEGTPIPTSVVPLGLLMLAFHYRELYPVRALGVPFHLITLIFLLSGSLMISKTLRIPKP